MSDKKAIKKQRISIYLPSVYMKRAEEMGNVSHYFRRASDSLEVHQESIFLADYLYLIRKMHRSMKDMTNFYNAGKLNKKEEDFLRKQNDAFLKLLDHPWRDEIEEL